MKKFTLVACFISACSFSLFAAQPEIISESNAREYSQKIYSAFKAGKYKNYADLLPENLLKYVTEQNYKASTDILAQKLGKLGNMSFVTTLRQPNMTVLLWKVEYESKTGANFDCLVTTTFTIKNGKWVLQGFRFL